MPKREPLTIVVVETLTCSMAEKYAFEHIRENTRNSKFVSPTNVPRTGRVSGVIYLGSPIEGTDPLVHTTTNPEWFVRLILDPYWAPLLWGPHSHKEPEVVDLSGVRNPLYSALSTLAFGNVPWGITKVHDRTGLIYPFMKYSLASYQSAQDLLTQARSSIIKNLNERLKNGYYKTTRMVNEILSFTDCKNDYPCYNRGLVIRDGILRAKNPLYKHGRLREKSS